MRLLYAKDRYSKLKHIYIFFLISVIIISCSGEISIKPERNTSPTIDALILPEKVEVGAMIKLQVITRDTDGDRLIIKWQVSEGALDTANATWTAPKQATAVEITVFVSDRTHKAVSAKKTVQVISIKSSPQNQLPEPVPQPELPPPVESKPVIGQEKVIIIPFSGIIIRRPGLDDVSINIGQDINDLERLYGKASPGLTDKWLRFTNVFGFARFEVSLAGDKIELLTVYDPGYKTIGGIGIGSTRAEVRAIYGPPHEESTDDLEIYIPGGISFGYSEDSIVILAIIHSK